MRDQHDTGSTADAVWAVEPLAFRLRSPLHVGWRKVGNLMQARPYVPAKNLWAAVTAELARRQAEKGRAAKAEAYQRVGDDVANSLAFTYFFPALTPNPLKALYPSLTSGGLVYGEGQLAAQTFDYLFLDSYASTAIVAGQNSAETGSLHETEMLRPRTRPLLGTSLAGQLGDAADELGAPVYLVGYALVRGEGPAGWCEALGQLQIGGERRYGWGALRQVEMAPHEGKSLFGLYDLEPGDTPVLAARPDAPLLAHALAAEYHGAPPVAGLTGPVEPVVGRETNEKKRPGFGANVIEARICWAPGTRLGEGQAVVVGKYGFWQGPG